MRMGVTEFGFKGSLKEMMKPKVVEGTSAFGTAGQSLKGLALTSGWVG